MKNLLFLFCIAFVLVMGLSSHAQAQAFVPVVNPDMIEISFDGVTFQPATAYVSGITISTGLATGVHIYHARRGTVLHWEAQLGTPYTSEKVEWLVDTSLLPSGEHKLYMRFSFGVEEPAGSGIYRTSPPSVASEVEKLIGRPQKPIRNVE